MLRRDQINYKRCLPGGEEYAELDLEEMDVLRSAGAALFAGDGATRANMAEAKTEKIEFFILKYGK